MLVICCVYYECRCARAYKTTCQLVKSQSAASHIGKTCDVDKMDAGNECCAAYIIYVQSNQIQSQSNPSTPIYI